MMEGLFIESLINHFTRGKDMTTGLDRIKVESISPKLGNTYSVKNGPQRVFAQEVFNFLGITVTAADLHDESCDVFKSGRMAMGSIPLPYDLVMARKLYEFRMAGKPATPDFSSFNAYLGSQGLPKPSKTFLQDGQLTRAQTLRTAVFGAIADQIDGQIAAKKIIRKRATDSFGEGTAQ